MFHKPEGQTHLVEIPISDLRRLLPGPGYVWLDLSGEPGSEIWRFADVLGLDRSSIEEALDISLLPRIDEYERYVFVVLNGLVADTGQRLTTSEIDLFVAEHFLVTIHREDSAAVDWIQAQGEQLSHANLETPSHLAALIAHISTRTYLPIIDALEQRLDVLEELAMGADPRTVPEVHALRRDVVVLRRSVAPMRDVFGEAANSVHPAIDPGAQRLFDRVYQQLLLVVESFDGARNLLSSVQETYRGAVADQTNEIVKVLTVFSAVLLPLSVIASIWGMNFVEIPVAEHPWGFFILAGTMALVAIGLWVYFVRRGFVGGPRLKELPKSVGLGLLQIGTLPVKLAIGGIETTIRQVGRIVSEPGEKRPPG